MFERIKKALSFKGFKKSYDPLTDQLMEFSKQLAAGKVASITAVPPPVVTMNVSRQPVSFAQGAATIGNVYQPPTKKKTPIFKNEASRIYAEIQKDKNTKYNVNISYDNNYQQAKGWYSLVIRQEKITTELVNNLYATAVYGSVSTVHVSGVFIMGPQGIQTKYPHQSIKTMIKYLKELDYNDHLIKRITIKKSLQLIKISSKEMDLYPNNEAIL
jgi:hypothetical protein